jgi:hypothetical protein
MQGEHAALHDGHQELEEEEEEDVVKRAFFMLHCRATNNFSRHWTYLFFEDIISYLYLCLKLDIISYLISLSKK